MIANQGNLAAGAYRVRRLALDGRVGADGRLVNRALARGRLQLLMEGDVRLVFKLANPILQDPQRSTPPALLLMMACRIVSLIGPAHSVPSMLANHAAVSVFKNERPSNRCFGLRL